VLEAAIAQAGKEARCPSCDAVFVVPQVDPRTGLPVDHADPGDDGQYPAPVHAYAAAGHAAPHIIRLPDDSLAIECPSCHRQTDIRADNCPACGRPFTLEGSPQVVITASQSSIQDPLSLAVIGLLLSFCGGIGIIPAVIAVVRSVQMLTGRRRVLPGVNLIMSLIVGLAACVLSIGMFLAISGGLR
jgi:RNA polymerase subunit RPABC4/transcription elongation factor Spt4